jgi:transketolase
MMSQNINYHQLANAVRFLAIDAVERANSGHPGMPMGMANVATVLFTKFLQFYPQDAKWHNRDRFILSAGHGSMLLYSLLYLCGYSDINIDDIKNFRQLHSKCAGHPEFGELAGIETTTGPLGQGVATAVGMAISQKILAQRFGKIFNHKIYVLVGDGCLMEGLAYEALSLAGHLKLNNLIVLWDNNSISIDGKTSLTISENIHLRMQSFGFDVSRADGHDFAQIEQALHNCQDSALPTFIDFKTIIGYGANAKAGSEKSHGSPLGEAEIINARNNLDWQHQPFEIPSDIKQQWLQFSNRSADIYQDWQLQYNQLHNKRELDHLLNKKFPDDFWQKFSSFQNDIINQAQTQATRKSSWQVLDFITKNLNNIVAGSADLSESVLTKTANTTAINVNNFAGNYLHYGVREHAMAAIMNGLSLHANFIPYGGTFLVFADYCKAAIRLSALMSRQIIYILTHDSIGLGEDGPTHQPIEQLASLRSIPNLLVFRPCDSEETVASYQMALNATNQPSAMILSRQNLPFLTKHSQNYHCGAYVLLDVANPQVIIIASGSEVQIAVQVAKILSEKYHIASRVVSMLSFEIFRKQSAEYKQQVLPNNTVKCAIEAASYFGWHEFIGNDGIFIGMQTFGASGKAEDLFKHFAITVDNAVKQILIKLQ